MCVGGHPGRNLGCPWEVCVCVCGGGGGGGGGGDRDIQGGTWDGPGISIEDCVGEIQGVNLGVQGCPRNLGIEKLASRE